MKKSTRDKLTVALVAFGAANLVILMVYQFANPDMTEMRVFLNTWPLTVSGLAAFGVAIWLRQ